VFGVGGGGGNAINTMIEEGLQGVEFIAANTDAQALTMSKAQRIVQMGTAVTQGLGAGSQPNVGAAAAIYLESFLENGSLLAIAWGTTLSYVVKNIRHNAYKRVDVIQLLGGIGNKTTDTDANALALTLASAFNGDSYLLQAPFMVKSKVLRDLLMDEPHIQEHFQRLSSANVAVVGLGSTRPELSAQFRSGHISMEDAQSLRNEGAVGDICGRYIDIDGHRCETPLMDRIISASLDDLKRIPTVIGVACGEEKKDIITGALKGKYIDVLITDRSAALAILSEK